MRFGGGELSTGTMGNFQPELTPVPWRSISRLSGAKSTARFES
jgi:hypothetical protein